MQYTYTNVTQQIQTCYLASKDQNSVSVRTFVPGASLTLDYPGLNMYVPQYLSRMEIDVEFDGPAAPAIVVPTPVVEAVIEPVVIQEPAPVVIQPPAAEEVPPVVEPVVVEPPSVELPIETPIVEPPAPVVEPPVADPAPVEPKTAKVAKPKTTKKAKK